MKAKGTTIAAALVAAALLLATGVATAAGIMGVFFGIGFPSFVVEEPLVVLSHEARWTTTTLQPGEPVGKVMIVVQNIGSIPYGILPMFTFAPSEGLGGGALQQPLVVITTTVVDTAIGGAGGIVFHQWQAIPIAPGETLTLVIDVRVDHQSPAGRVDRPVLQLLRTAPPSPGPG